MTSVVGPLPHSIAPAEFWTAVNAAQGRQWSDPRLVISIGVLHSHGAIAVRELGIAAAMKHRARTSGDPPRNRIRVDGMTDPAAVVQAPG